MSKYSVWICVQRVVVCSKLICSYDFYSTITPYYIVLAGFSLWGFYKKIARNLRWEVAGDWNFDVLFRSRGSGGP